MGRKIDMLFIRGGISNRTVEERNREALGGFLAVRPVLTASLVKYLNDRCLVHAVNAIIVLIQSKY